MSIVPGAQNSKAVMPDGLQSDHISENTVGHGVSIQGRTSGVAIDSGYVGETINSILANANTVSLVTNSWVDVTNWTISIGAGIWLLSYSCRVNTSNNLGGGDVRIGIREGSNTLFSREFKSSAGATAWEMETSLAVPYSTNASKILKISMYLEGGTNGSVNVGSAGDNSYFFATRIA